MGTFTSSGLRTKQGTEVRADLIVTATGMNMQNNFPFSTVHVTIDDVAPLMKDRLTYRGLMLDEIPNLAFSMGYTNASWTLKSDLSAQYVCRLLNLMYIRGYAVCTPRADDSVEVDRQPPLSSSYFVRNWENSAKGGSKSPWRVLNNYLFDKWVLEWTGDFTASLEFGKTSSSAASGKKADDTTAVQKDGRRRSGLTMSPTLQAPPSRL